MKAICGHDIPNKDVKFCPECGKKVDFPPQPEPTTFARIDYIPKIAFSPDEAAHAAGLSVSMIRQLCYSGQLKHGKSGTRTVIRLEALEEYLERIEAETMGLPNVIKFEKARATS